MDDRRIHSSTYCSLCCLDEQQKNTFFTLPYLIPYARRAPPNTSSRIPRKNTSVLSYKALCGMKQSFQYLAFNMLCFAILTFHYPLRFFLFLLPFFLLFYTLSPISTMSSCFTSVWFFFPFYASFPPGRCSSLAQLIIEAWRGELESWQKALLFSVYAGRGLGFGCCQDFSEVILELVQQLTVKELQFQCKFSKVKAIFFSGQVQ